MDGSEFDRACEYVYVPPYLSKDGEGQAILVLLQARHQPLGEDALTACRGLRLHRDGQAGDGLKGLIILLPLAWP